MALLGAVCTQFPDAQLAIIFLPFFTFSAKSVTQSFVVFLINLLIFYYSGSYRYGVL